MVTPVPLRDFGLWYAARGWAVSPLRPRGKLPFGNCDLCRPPIRTRPNPSYQAHDPSECPCIAAGDWCHGLRAATTNPDVIAGWINRCPTANIAVNMGMSGLLVLDYDCHSDIPAPAQPLPGVEVDPAEAARIVDGAGAFGLLCRHRGQPWPVTLNTKTPTGGGRHDWFTIDKRFDFTQSAGKLAWQVDVKAGSSYAVAPGSVTASGKYETANRQDPVPLPEWIAAELVRTGHVRPTPTPPRPADWRAPQLTSGCKYVEKAMAEELHAVATCTSGRWAQIRKSAVSLGELVGAGLLDRNAVHAAITDAAAAAGVSPHEHKAQSAIEWGLDHGAARPRIIPVQGAHR